MNAIEIRVVNNGYWVRPPSFNNDGRMTLETDINVFETFGALVAFLESNIRKDGTPNAQQLAKETK